MTSTPFLPADEPVTVMAWPVALWMSTPAASGCLELMSELNEAQAGELTAEAGRWDKLREECERMSADEMLLKISLAMSSAWAGSKPCAPLGVTLPADEAASESKDGLWEERRRIGRSLEAHEGWASPPSKVVALYGAQTRRHPLDCHG